MNRAQRRELKRKHKDIRAEFADRLNLMAEEIENPLHDGDLVRVDVDRITGRSDYAHTQQSYRDFVEGSRDKIFTVRLYRKREDGFSALAELVGVPNWIFWYGDLIRVKEGA